jgi:peptidoglycan-N-acetylglucosamine deacetylase
VPSLRRPLGIEDRIASRTGVALTFDDGPHPGGTPAVLECLERFGARATFFLVGEQVVRRPALASEIVAAGHDVGLHCHRHRHLLRQTPRQLRDDLARAVAAIGEATGRTPRLYRAPYGIFSGSSLAIARRNGWRPFLWTRWGRDWEPHATRSSIAGRLLRGLRAGDVLLLHDADFYGTPGSWRQTCAALEVVLAEIGRAGLTTLRLETDQAPAGSTATTASASSGRTSSRPTVREATSSPVEAS